MSETSSDLCALWATVMSKQGLPDIVRDQDWVETMKAVNP